ncbi:hypothetical protein [Phascolarctobacterium sp.]
MTKKQLIIIVVIFIIIASLVGGYFLTNKSCKFMSPTIAIEKLRANEFLILEMNPSRESNNWQYIERIYTQDDIIKFAQNGIRLGFLGEDRNLLDASYSRNITDILVQLSEKYQQESYTIQRPQHKIKNIRIIFSAFDNPVITILYTDKCELEINVNIDNNYEHMKIIGKHPVSDNYNITQKFNK